MLLRIFFITCITLLFSVRIPRNPRNPRNPYAYEVSPYYSYIKYFQFIQFFWNFFLYYNLIQRILKKEYNGTLLAIKALLPYLNIMVSALRNTPKTSKKILIQQKILRQTEFLKFLKSKIFTTHAGDIKYTVICWFELHAYSGA